MFQYYRLIKNLFFYTGIKIHLYLYINSHFTILIAHEFFVKASVKSDNQMQYIEFFFFFFWLFFSYKNLFCEHDTK